MEIKRYRVNKGKNQDHQYMYELPDKKDLNIIPRFNELFGSKPRSPIKLMSIINLGITVFRLLIKDFLLFSSITLYLSRLMYQGQKNKV